jgi:hypothetical protein
MTHSSFSRGSGCSFGISQQKQKVGLLMVSDFAGLRVDIPMVMPMIGVKS